MLLKYKLMALMMVVIELVVEFVVVRVVTVVGILVLSWEVLV